MTTMLDKENILEAFIAGQHILEKGIYGYIPFVNEMVKLFGDQIKDDTLAYYEVLSTLECNKDIVKYMTDMATSNAVQTKRSEPSSFCFTVDTQDVIPIFKKLLKSNGIGEVLIKIDEKGCTFTTSRDVFGPIPVYKQIGHGAVWVDIFRLHGCFWQSISVKYENGILHLDDIRIPVKYRHSTC